MKKINLGQLPIADSADPLCSLPFTIAKKNLKEAEQNLERRKKDVRFLLNKAEETFLRDILFDILRENKNQCHRLKRIITLGNNSSYNLAFDDKIIGVVDNPPGTDYFSFKPAPDFIPGKKL